MAAMTDSMDSGARADHLLDREGSGVPRQHDAVLPGLPDALVAVLEGVSPPIVKQPIVAAGPVSAQPEVPPAASALPVTAGPVSLTARIVELGSSGVRGLFLPFEASVGAAAVARGDELLFIFDTARPFDLSAVRDDPLGARSSVRLLPEATVLRLPGRRADQVGLRRLSNGWFIGPREPGDTPGSITPRMRGAELSLPIQAPGRVVVVPDPRSGGDLLVGTTRSDHDAVTASRHGSVATIEKTILGIVITPLSDRLELRPTTDAFLLSGAAPAALAPEGAILGQDAETGPRVMSLNDEPVAVLYRRFKAATAAAAAAPAASRFLPRLAAAQDALALGDGRQAATIARVAAADDAREATAPCPQLVLAAAALIDHHAEGTDLLDDPELAVAGEVGFWRAVKLAERDPSSPEAARRFAANLALLRVYPAPLRNMLVPLAAESLARAGSTAQAALVSTLQPARQLDFAEALLAERQGRKAAALAELDRLAFDRDLRVADEAVEEAVTLRQAMPAAKPGKLADLLEAHLLDARITGHEATSMLHLATLRTQAGQWEKALQLLREVAYRHPEQQREVRDRVAQVLKSLASAASSAEGGAALDQAALIEANADMLPDGAAGSQISLFLATRLKALDLPERAAPIVQRMMRAAGPGPDKAMLGSQLAALDLQQGDFAGARAALDESGGEGLPREAAEPRLILMARALAGAGQPDQALAEIAPLRSPAALELRASLLCSRGDWAGATDTLLLAAGHDLPAAGQLDAAGQDLMLRLASAASRTADRTRIGQARRTGEGRFADPGKQALFQLLTSDPVPDDVHRLVASSEVPALDHAAAVLNTISK